MTSDLSQAQIDRILEAVRAQYPDWESFDHSGFVKDESTYKRKTISKAAETLAASELQRLLASEQYDEILKRLESIGRDLNLLYQAVPTRGDLGILYADRLDKQQFCTAVIDLLHGEDDSIERLDQYLGWVERSKLPNRWTFPTYFLFVCHPDSEIFVKPGVTAGFLELLGWKEELRGGPTAAWYDRLRTLAHQLREAFANRGARDMVDIQSLIWVCGQQKGPGYWKIAPEKNAVLWDAWREGGYASIGWGKLGDVSLLNREQFEARRAGIEKEDKGYTAQGAGQVWRFAHIREGDRIVANQGHTRVLGIGTVTGPYSYQPDIEHGHRLPVQWTDLRPREVRQSSWNNTLRSLTRFQFQEIVDAPSPSEPRQDGFGDLLSALRSKRLEFSAETVSNYLLALQTRRFVILSGIAGTGKTRLALEVARFFQSTVANHVVEAVRPDWTDHRGLLGYFNPLTGRYVSTPFLDLLLRAGQEADAARAEGRTPRPFFAILDEMNLARVEHYFSDFLSALESGEPLRLHEGGGEPGEDGPIPRAFRVSENLFFTGTVNVDESTYMFSPKVLDRAFSLELNEVRLERLSEATAEPGGGLRLARFSGLLTFEGMPASEPWNRFSELLEGDLRRMILELNDLLAAENRHFGYRVAGEIARFVELAAEQSGGDESQLRAALDLALLQKVLPKFHGTQQELEEVLGDLFRFAVLGRRWKRDDPDPAAFNWTVSGGALQGTGNPALPRFALKVWRMRRRLERQGFTSFIE